MHQRSISIGQAALVIGVSVSTLRRWEKECYFFPCFRTCGGHRRYSISAIEKKFFFNQIKHQDKYTILYSRVSSKDQEKDLKTQSQRLQEHADGFHWKTLSISDVGNGLNCKKKGLKKLLSFICQGQVERLVLTHRDRLLRFGSELLFQVCDHFGVEVVILDERRPQGFYEQLSAEIIELVVVSSARLYGKRSHENRKKLKKSA